MEKEDKNINMNITDSNFNPKHSDLINGIEETKRKLLVELCDHIEKTYKAKVQVDFSTCSMARGWNFKYKKSGRAVCTVYPEKDGFVMLITLNLEKLDYFNVVKDNFTEYIKNLVSTTTIFNKTKWLMINVDSAQIAEDVKKILSIKFM